MGRRLTVALFAGALLMGSPLSVAFAIVPGNPGAGDVTFQIDASAVGTEISPLIYGVNGSLRPSGVTAIRLGGNRWTGYNWETNNSNAGADYLHSSDQFLTGAYGQTTAPGAAILPTLQEAASIGATANLTIPMAGYVSADQNGTVTPAETAPSARWNQVVQRKSEVYPGSALSLTPNLSDNYVFNDELVHWIEANRQSGQSVNYILDNEPALWEETHPYLYGSTNPTFADVGTRSLATASMIKDLAPNAPVLGGVTFGWSGAQTLGDAADFDDQVASDGGRQLDKLQFNRWLLKEFAAEEAAQERVLMDALDMHWYPEARGDGLRITAEGAGSTSAGVVEARLQAPRSLWDPTYIEDSWITNSILVDYSGQGNDQGIELLNRMRADIEELKPGTKISISEYNYGGGHHISGAIAQADVLGIFGREGVWNASWWPIQSEANSQYTRAGFEAFTDFDGQGGRFGDLSLEATTNDIESSSVYASRSAENPNELIVVAINRTEAPLDAAIEITDQRVYKTAEIFQLTDAGPNVVAAGDQALNALNAFLYEMPAYSVSTIRLVAAGPAGDFNADGAVNAADYTLWRDHFGTSYNSADYQAWLDNYGYTTASPTTAVPEPTAWWLMLVAISNAARKSRSCR